MKQPPRITTSASVDAWGVRLTICTPGRKGGPLEGEPEVVRWTGILNMETAKLLWRDLGDAIVKAEK